ncbi:MAG: hypothetical protein ACTSU2_15820 [Promethearchaeota archaeon]
MSDIENIFKDRNLRLTDEQIEELKKPVKKKKILKIVLLIFGLLFFIGGILLIFMLYVKWLDIEIGNYRFDLSYLVGIFVSAFGLWLMTKFWTLQEHLLRESVYFIPKLQKFREEPERKIQFGSISNSRLIGSFIFIVIGAANLIVLGADISHEQKYGSWFFLGGPSWSYPLGLPLIIIGFGLVIYLFISSNITIIFESENLYQFYEIRLLAPWLTEIPKKDIEAIRLLNNKNGPQWLWLIMIFYPIEFFHYAKALFNLNWPSEGYPKPILPDMMLISAIFVLIAVIIINIFQHDYLEIATKDKLYEMWFNAPFASKTIIDQIADMFDLYPVPKSMGMRVDSMRQLSSGSFYYKNRKIYVGSPRTFYRLILGIVLFVLALYSYLNETLLNEFLAGITIYYSLLLIFKGLREDISTPNKTILSIDLKEKCIRERKINGKYYEYHKFLNVDLGFANNNNNINDNNNNINDKNNSKDIINHTHFQFSPRKLDFYDIVIPILMIFFAISGWVYQFMLWAPVYVDLYNIPFVIVEMILILLVIFEQIRPIDTMCIRTKSIPKYQLNIEGFFRSVAPEDILDIIKIGIDRARSKLPPRQAILYYINKFKVMWKLNKRTIKIRLISYLIIGLISMMFAIIWIRISINP